MITVEQIKKLVNDKLKESDNFLVDVAVRPGNKILILVDNENGISIEDCVQMSRHVEFSLDREKEDFELQVSSPGADSAFKVLRQYIKHTGKEVQVTTTEGEKINGILKSANNEGFDLELKPVKKKGQKKSESAEASVKHFKYNQIKETKGVISFK